MSEVQDRRLRQSYSEIISGFSITSTADKQIYVKHFSPLDNLELDFLYTDYYKKVAEQGYPTEKQRLELLEKDRLWTAGDENNISLLKTNINGLLTAKKKAFLKRDIDSIHEQIKEQENLLQQSVFKRERLIGPTVEKFTRKKMDAYLIGKSFYADPQLTQLIYSKEEFEDLEPDELSTLFLAYNDLMDNFSELNLKKIAISSFFQNAFSLCESVYEFYGRPVCYLTNFQIHLSAYGGYYKNILQSEYRPPDEIINDPEKIEDWYSSRKNVEQMLDKNVQQEGGSVSVMGATKEDLKNWGYDQQTVSLAEETKKKGGLNKEELMKLYGVK